MFSLFGDSHYQNQINSLQSEVYELKKRIIELESMLYPQSEIKSQPKFDFVDFILTYGPLILVLSALVGSITEVISFFSTNVIYYQIARFSSWVLMGCGGLWLIFTGLGHLQNWFDEKMRNK